MSGVFVFKGRGGDFSEAVASMDKLTQEWTMRAARGECSWICADCCMSFPEGMPAECAHGHQSCTDIIKRDKADAQSK
ncbi:hypothetical protein [Cupriavidus oxalaticus]|uniref:hypothetical protein n=1 Tax=Cupriavidus oxalaticus TaxID=96344 RepID=UPI003171A7F6